MDYKALEIKYQNGKEIFIPVHRTYLISNDDFEIVQQYNAEVRGLYNYYKIADNVNVLGHFNYVMKFSMYKTFAGKYRVSMRKIIRCPKEIRLQALWGEIPDKARRKDTVLL